jgi:hypothetical protein
MRKFKLIKTFPNSPKINTIVEETSAVYVFKDSEEENWFNCHSYPEFWEEVKDEFPKIVSFRSKQLNTIYERRGEYFFEKDRITGSITEQFLSQPFYEIYQVAIDKDTIFTIGDKVEFPGYDPGRTITKFWINKENELDSLSADFGEYGYMFAKQLKKVKSPILITFDNKEVYEGDTVWNLNLNDWCYNSFSIQKSWSLNLKD